MFLQHERIDAIRIITRNNSNHAVGVTLIERDRGAVIDRGLQFDQITTHAFQALLGSFEKQRSQAASPRIGDYVNGDNVPRPPHELGYDKTRYRLTGFFCCRAALSRSRPCRNYTFRTWRRAHRNQRKRSFASQISFEFSARVRNASGKTVLVNVPQDLEIVRFVIADFKLEGDRHSAIVTTKRSR